MLLPVRSDSEHGKKERLKIWDRHLTPCAPPSDLGSGLRIDRILSERLRQERKIARVRRDNIFVNFSNKAKIWFFRDLRGLKAASRPPLLS